MLKQRVITAAILAPVALLGVWFSSSGVFASVMGVILAVGAWEWARLSGLESAITRSLYFILFGGLLLTFWRLSPELSESKVVVAVGVFWWLLALAWLSRPTIGAANDGVTTVVKLSLGLVVLFVAWWSLVLLHGGVAWGADVVLFLLFAIWIADIGAYFAGKRFGKRKLAPSISPGKSIEGVVGGLLGLLIWGVLGAVYFTIEGMAFAGFVGLVLITGLVSVEGDLVESILKRQAGVKDSGTILPGHGGVLDRLDSLIAASPVFVAGLAVLGV